MEESRKNLKTCSFLVLILGVASLIKAIFEICFVKIDMSQLPEGTTEDFVWTFKIIILVLSMLILLPQFYIGFKGLHVAKKPTSSKTHIRWAIVLLVITVIGFVSSIIELIKGNQIAVSISTLFDVVLEGIIYYEYIKYAGLIAKGN